MKKRLFIGISITVLVLSVIIGIASLPDEVLIDSSSLENSQPLPEDIPPVTTLEESQDSIPNSDAQNNTNAELDALKNEIKELKNELVDLKTNSQVPNENLTITQVEDVTPKVDDVAAKADSQEKSQGQVITINLKDGVGAKQR